MRRLWYPFILLAVAALVGILALASWPVPVTAADTQTLRVANELYDRAELDDAIRLYQQLADSGIRSHALYYNLGLAYHAVGETGQAMRYWRMAEALAPRDPAIQAQVAALRAETGARPPARDIPQRLDRALEWIVSMDETAALALGGWLLFALLVFAVSALRPGFFRSLLRAVSILAGVFALVGILTFGARLYVRLLEPPAVVVADTVSPSAEPGATTEGRMTLRQGAEVAILERRDDYVLLLLPGSGNVGWVPANSVAPVGS